MVQPTLLAGRWLLTEDDNAIVVNQNVIRNEPDLGVGDELRMRINSQELTWRIVGIVQVLGSDNNACVSYSYFSRQTNTVNQASFAQITLKNHDTLHAQTAASQLEQGFEQAGVRLTNVRTVAALREQNESAFTIIVSILLIMGVLIAAVGALGLMGTMSINVLERTREFAIMRSIGASNQAILQIVIVEGLIIGLFSWSLGALVAYPAGAWLTSAIGTILFQTTLHYVFAIEGLVYWLLIIVVLAVLASILPARNASRLTVRDALAYE